MESRSFRLKSQYPSYFLPSWARGRDRKAQVQAAEDDEQSQSLMNKNQKGERNGLERRIASRVWSRRLLFVAMTFIFSSLSGAATVWIAGLHHGSTSDPGRPVIVMEHPCGSSPAEAVARGCHFDVISFCWLPDACYDTELAEEFRANHKLEWFVDPDKQHPLSYEQIMTGEHTGLYVNWEYHVAHCTTMWKKMHRAILGDLGKSAIDGYIGSYDHTKHCEMMLLSDRDVALETINTRIAVKYPNCGIE
ncbi:hypothetical protein F5B22DRAFT_54612 [Xylaria bambusicola]|uniref:uncharacterized protein n=1 Tax=Xylaria bambusicola TaxID=326684 RepID=UPI0020079C32|nr:uncharacterized protein F5B22DRAFT_54612 [Xylaria bambusicola]KAI0520847.1 hypothetical protein F5B22DRAFT_54612 [Xylaria bambusicola]